MPGCVSREEAHDHRRALAPHAVGGSGIVDWVTTTDHKKIGLLYIFSGLAFFILSGILSLPVLLIGGFYLSLAILWGLLIARIWLARVGEQADG